MAMYGGTTKINITVRKYGVKDISHPTTTGTQPKMELLGEVKQFDLSIKEALQELIDLLSHY